MISSSRNEEMSSGTDEMKAELDAGGNAGLQNFHYALRKFRNPCENFNMHSFSLSYRNFAIIAKVTVHRENLNFRYALYFLYNREILLS